MLGNHVLTSMPVCGIQPSCCRTLGFTGCVLRIPKSTRQCKAASVNQPHCLFVKPLESIYSQLPCRPCQGTGYLICDKCEGKGRLGKGGFHKKNPVDLDRITGSKWTALERTFGWRHFMVVSKQRGHGKQWFLEMVATCDKTTHFWINANNLKWTMLPSNWQQWLHNILWAISVAAIQTPILSYST